MGQVTLREAYLRQATSDLAAYGALEGAAQLPSCHRLHYLQMAAEKLAKAVLLATGSRSEADVRGSHKAFSLLPGILRGRRCHTQLDYATAKAFDAFLSGISGLCRAIDELSPSIGPQQAGGGSPEGANCEYPWFGRTADGRRGWVVPAEWGFVVEQLLLEGNGPRLIPFVRKLVGRFDQLFP